MTLKELKDWVDEAIQHNDEDVEIVAEDDNGIIYPVCYPYSWNSKTQTMEKSYTPKTIQPDYPDSNQTIEAIVFIV